MSSSKSVVEQYPMPHALKRHIIPVETSLFRGKDLTKSFYWSEICFVALDRSTAWRFMGVSLNRTINIENKLHTEELASSIFRSDPVQDIAPPWECIYTFCETALQSSLGRIAIPFACVSSMRTPQLQSYLPLRHFNYQTREWRITVSSLSDLSAE